jgi:hypothetical protein
MGILIITTLPFMESLQAMVVKRIGRQGIWFSQQQKVMVQNKG